MGDTRYAVGSGQHVDTAPSTPNQDHRQSLSSSYFGPITSTSTGTGTGTGTGFGSSSPPLGSPRFSNASPQPQPYSHSYSPSHNEKASFTAQEYSIRPPHPQSQSPGPSRSGHGAHGPMPYRGEMMDDQGETSARRNETPRRDTDLGLLEEGPRRPREPELPPLYGDVPTSRSQA